MKIEAAARIAKSEVLAAEGSEKKAIKYLTEIGFTGVTLKKSDEDILTFKYEKYNEKMLNKKLGAPKETTKSESIRYNVPGAGVLAVWPGRKEVIFKNSKRGQ